jgi:hypothetical protein
MKEMTQKDIKCLIEYTPQNAMPITSPYANKKEEIAARKLGKKTRR